MSSWERYRQTMRAGPTLWSTAKANDSVALRMLLRGADINARDSRGYSPLMLAAYSGSLEAAEILLRTGADANTSDDAGNSALMGAAFKGDVFMLDLLLWHGAKIDARNNVGMTALDYAVMFGRKAAQEKLAVLQEGVKSTSRFSVIAKIMNNCFFRAA